MRVRNQTSVTEFILLGFSDHPLLQGLICGTVLLIYLSSVLGNFVFLILMYIDPRLHKPMYFFLSHLSFLDICSPSITLPKMLANFFIHSKSITYHTCMTQVYFFVGFTSTESNLLAIMAYDRYVAICDPLHYTLTMKKTICSLLATTSWTLGFLAILPYPWMLSQISFCMANEINHFFCDLTALIKLSCSDTHNLEIVILFEGSTLGFIPFLLTLISYIFIISSILRIRCTEGRRKAFSTCASHLTSVILFYWTLFCVYLRPSSMYSPAQDKLFSLLYTALIPMLNPIIYSLRNKDVRNSIKKIYP
ncbi:olfactory receptor 1F1-like [Rhinatrema bivittatum]|uniref:olfactory receptor 1F1-like n=1 Tax=Rhinatrema bivittatum TaxID=194408 RepID=UPI00112D7806|nr:olfactory receptor 1F1-like [Rhinatrema bivittatum]